MATCNSPLTTHHWPYINTRLCYVLGMEPSWRWKISFAMHFNSAWHKRLFAEKRVFSLSDRFFMSIIYNIPLIILHGHSMTPDSFSFVTARSCPPTLSPTCRTKSSSNGAIPKTALSPLPGPSFCKRRVLANILSLDSLFIRRSLA